MFQSNKKRTPTTNNGGNKNEKHTIRPSQKRRNKRRGKMREEKRNIGEKKKEKEIKNEIKTLIQKGKLPQDTLNQ